MKEERPMMPDPSPPRIQANMVIRNIGQLVTIAQQPIPGASSALQVISDAALAVHNSTIVWIGPDDAAEPMFYHDTGSPQDGITIVDAQGAVVTPGLVDSHTHLVFAGDRSEEFYLRRSGVSYAELLAQGRGILTTVNATRQASTDRLMELARARLDIVRAYGTTTVEVKTGYGLDKVTEETCLRIINNLNVLEETSPSLHSQVRVVPTFLGAHTVPPEYQGRRDEYVTLIVEEMLPSFVGLARFCDVFCEREAFTAEECRRILTRARELGYQLKIHADQDALRDAGVVATLLPGCSYTLRSPYLQARRFLDRGLRVALATDFNPGTSYCENMQTMIGLVMSSMDMTLEEALTAATINGARALQLEKEVGSLEVGKRCELALWSIKSYQEIGYHFGINLIQSVLVQR